MIFSPRYPPRHTHYSITHHARSSPVTPRERQFSSRGLNGRCLDGLRPRHDGVVIICRGMTGTRHPASAPQTSPSRARSGRLSPQPSPRAAHPCLSCNARSYRCRSSLTNKTAPQRPRSSTGAAPHVAPLAVEHRVKGSKKHYSNIDLGFGILSGFLALRPRISFVPAIGLDYAQTRFTI